VLTWSGQVQVWHLYALAFLLGTINALDFPCRLAFFAELVGPADVTNAVALNAAAQNAARMLGAAVAGIAISLVGAWLCFLLNALSFAAFFACVLALLLPELKLSARGAMPTSLRDVGSNLEQGIRYVWVTPVVRLMLITVGLANIFGLSFFNAVLLVIAASELKLDARGYAFLTTALVAGAFASAVLIALLPRARIKHLLIALLLLGAGNVALATVHVYPVALIATFCAGLGLWGSAAIGNSIVQLTVPGALRGRVMGAWMTAVAGLSPIGAAITAATGSAFGINAAVLVAASVVATAAAIVVLALRRGFIRDDAVGQP
jgi:predicted MFS family arabinose efflux permease